MRKYMSLKREKEERLTLRSFQGPISQRKVPWLSMSNKGVQIGKTRLLLVSLPSPPEVMEGS